MRKKKCRLQDEFSESVKLSSFNLVASRVITSIEYHDEQLNHGEIFRLEVCFDDFKECTSNLIPFEETPSLDQVQYDYLQGDFILNDCICFNYQEFRHITSMYSLERYLPYLKRKTSFLKSKKLFMMMMESLLIEKSLN